MKKNNSKLSAAELAMLGILIALVLILLLLGSSPAGPLKITTAMIPVAMAAIVLGTKGSAIIGAFFGLFSFLQAIGALPNGSALLVALAGINAPLTFIQCFVPRLLCGILTGLAYSACVKKMKAPFSCGIAGFGSAFFNTLFFIPCLFLLFGNSQPVMNIRSGRGVLVTIAGMITLNVVCEWISATIIASAVGSALRRAGFGRQLR